MITFYRIPKEDRHGIGFTIDMFTSEDFYFSFSDNKKEHNEKRKLRFIIHMVLLIWQLNIRIPLKHVGNVYYGRKMKD